MATYTAAAGGGNWNDTATWEEGGGYPGSGDNAVFDSGSGNVTVNVASACLDITCTGYTGTLTLGADLSVYGSLLFVAGMTFTPSTYKVIFAATTSGKTITSGGKTFGAVTFNGSGGVWTLQDTLTQGGVLTLTTGEIVFNGNSLVKSSSADSITMGSGMTLTIGTGTFNIGLWANLTVGTGSTVTIGTGIADIRQLTVSGSGVFTCSGASTIKIRYRLTISSSGWTPSTSTVVWLYNGSYINSTQPLYNLQVGDANNGSYDCFLFTNNLTVQNNVSVVYKSGYVRELDLAGLQLTVGGNFTNDDIFTHNNGTVVFNDAAKTSIISGTGTITFNTLRCLTANKTVKFQQGKTITVSSFDFTGASGQLITLDTDTGSGTFTLSDTTGTNQVEYCHIYRSVATGGATWLAYTTDGNVDGGGNSGWVFSTGVPFDPLMLAGD